MIIRLVGADFSSQNIGQISIPKILSAETSALLGNYTRALTDTKKFAVQDFINGLKAKGVWDRITNLYLPVLAGTLGETMLNVKTNVKDATPNATDYALSTSHGIKGTTAYGSTLSGSPMAIKYTGSRESFHAMFYHMETLTGNQGIFGSSPNDYVRAVYYSYNATNLTVSLDPYSHSVIEDTAYGFASTDRTTAVAPSFHGYTQRTDGNTLLSNNLVDKSIPLPDDTTYSNLSLYPLLTWNNKSGGTTPFGLFSFGASLTDQQITDFQTLTNTLMGVIAS